MKYKKFTFLFFFLCFLYITPFFARIWYVDPLHLFHKPYVCKESIFDNMRLSNAGLIKHYDFNNIILGSSMLENTSANEASQILGGKFINLSMAGSFFYERSFVLDFTLKNKKISKVVYSLDDKNILSPTYRHTDYDPELFSFLYDNNPFNDYKIYLTDEFLEQIFRKENCIKSDIDRPKAWFKYRGFTATMGGFDKWIMYKNNNLMPRSLSAIVTAVENIKNNDTQQLLNTEKRINEATQYIDDNILKFVIKNPDIEFLLFIPPYSRLNNAIDAQAKREDFIVYRESIRYLVEESKQYKNIKVYAWGNTAYPDNIANYRDLHHYAKEFNSLMLHYMAQDIGLLTPENFDEYYNEFEQKSLQFDLVPFYEKIKRTEKNKKDYLFIVY